MRVPVRRLPETRVSEQQQGYARPVAPLNVSPLTDLVEGFRDQLLDEQDARQRVTLNRRLLQEVNELQGDFAARRTDPEISSIDFAATTNAAYTERHTTLLNELRGEGYSQDLLDDFEGRLGTVRQGLFERGLSHQITQLDARADEEIEEIGRQGSQYAANNPDGYATARDTLLDSVRTMPGLTEERRAALIDRELAVIQDGAGRALAMQRPQYVIDTLDPHGLTAPHPTTVPSAPGTTPTAASGWQGVATTVATELGLDPVEVAAVMSYETGGTFSPTVMGGTGGNHMGLIQFGREERQQYGITANSNPEEWSTAILSFMRDRGFRRGMSLLDFYSTINAGSPGRPNASDSPGNTVRTHLDRLLREHRGPAERWLGAATPAVASGPVQTATVLPVDLPPSSVRQQSDSTIGVIPVDAPGLRVPGNIDLASRPTVTNADGTVSTVRSISVGTDRGEVLIPTVIEGRVVSEAEATEHYRATGEHLGIFDTPEHATAYAQQLHDEQARATGVSAPTDISSIRTGNALLDDLNGPERLRLLGLAREQMNRVTATQRAEMDVTIGNITAETGNGIATPLPTEQQVLQTYGPVEGPQRWAQIQQAVETDRAMQSFSTQSATDIQRALDTLEPTPGSPTYAAELQIYQAAERAAQALLTAREQDPASYAMQHFPAVREASQRSTAHYYAALDRAYETLGINPRTAPVMSPEAAEQMATQYREMTPDQRREFLRTNFAQMGEDRFRRLARDMEGTTAESDMRMFALIRTYPGQGWGNIFNQALEGREAIAQDPARRPNSEQVTILFRQYGLSAIRNLNTDASRAIQEMAEGLYVQWGGDPADVAGNSVLYRRALAAALGGSLPVDMNHGQVSDYTILPPRTSEHQFQTWIERQTLESLSATSVERRPPRYGDLRTAVPISTIINEGVFVMVAPGQYWIKMGSDGRPLMTSTGHPFVANIDPREVVRAAAGTVRGTAVIRRPTPRIGGGVM